MQQRMEQNLAHLAREARQFRIHWDRNDILKDAKMTWTPHLKALLCGVNDPTCNLKMLKGHESSLVAHVYGYVFPSVWENWKLMLAPRYKRFVRNTIPAPFLSQKQNISEDMALKLQASCDDPIKIRVNASELMPLLTATARHVSVSPCAFSRCGILSFPEPSDVDVNMLPFIMGDKYSLPEPLQKYYDPLIAKCPIYGREIGKVCYLSITERFIAEGDTQRRGGLHIEAPVHKCDFSPGIEIRASWGGGRMGCDGFEGGIFIASTVSNTCAIYDALIEKETTDSHGGMEHLRPLLNSPYLVPANELIWMTDRTPHQALPQPKQVYRQFFRLVTSDLNVWHSQHCTANPKVPLPEHVRVIDRSRFDLEHYDERKPPARG